MISVHYKDRKKSVEGGGSRPFFVPFYEGLYVSELRQLNDDHDEKGLEVIFTRFTFLECCTESTLLYC